MSSSIKLTKDYVLNNDSSTFIIAEAGINHNGNFDLAKELIKMAKRCGADCVKFQKRTVEDVFTKDVLDRDYSTSINSFGDTYRQHKLNSELTEDQFRELKSFADSTGILFTASPWDCKSVDLLDSIGVPFFKVASADLTNLPLLDHIAKKGKPIILSTGMSDMKTVEYCYNFVHKRNPQVMLLQCTSSYPSKPCNINLNVIKTYQKKFPECVIGYSGHELGTDISLMAVCVGAKIVERHFTLNKNMKGADHKASLEESELAELVRKIRLFETVSGSYEKKSLDNEAGCFKKLSKSIVYRSSLPKHTVLTPDHLITKSAATLGVSPLLWYDMIGKTLICDVDEDTLLKIEDTI